MPDRREFLRELAIAPLALGAVGSRSRVAGTPQEAAERFIASYVEKWLPLETAASQAAWVASTDVSDAHTADTVAAQQKLTPVIGSLDVIAGVKEHLAKKDQLSELVVRQLEKIRLRAAEAPATIPDVVKARTEAEAKQSATQDAFSFKSANGQTLSANDIDRILLRSRDLEERRAAWEVSKTIGRPLRAGILTLRDLRNNVARQLGFDNFFALQVADYGMTVAAMSELCESFLTAMSPLYQQLHTWAKYELARRYKATPPDGPIPAHWLPNRWGQNWPGLVESVDMDAPFAGKPREFITEQAERFYVSLGFPKLPKSFWERSDLYPADANSGRKKNSHASAWHIDLQEDVRSLMSIEPNSQWFNTAHHELGHIYYYISYSTPKVPYLLRAGANRAFHEGVGDLIGVAAGQRPYLKQVGLLTPDAEKADQATWLLDTALDRSLTFIPFSAGTMTHFERDFYSGAIDGGKLNEAWWSIVRRFQGITPPGDRPEDLCDAATKTHINDDPAQYYDYAIGTILKYQLHDHIAREILKQDPRECNYFGNARVGEFLRGILELGATRDWNRVLKDATGEGLSARHMVSYFAPLQDWLEKQNKGRAIGWT